MSVLTQRHSDCITRFVETVPDALAALETWQPHLTIINMDGGGTSLLEQASTVLGARGTASLPAIVLTRRGTLKATFGAFEHGVDDVRLVTLAPEELLARTRAVVRRTSSVPFPSCR